MTSESIFNLATQKKGGRSPNQAQHFKDYSKRANYFLTNAVNDKLLLKELPPIIFDFVNNDKFNAFAMKYEEYYIIGIYEPVVLIFRDLFNRMLSHPEIFKNVGDISKENSDRIHAIDYYSNVTSLINEGYKNNYHLIRPIDSIRQSYAEHLATLAIDFVFQHELSHILFGHLDYLNHEYGIEIFAEFHSFYDKQLLNIDLQTLEMDADATAIARCCQFAGNVVMNPNIVNKSIISFYSNQYEAFSDIYFAIDTAFKLFGDGNFKDLTVGKSSHPNPRIRHLYLSNTFEPFINKYMPELDWKILKEKVLEKFSESIKAYHILTGKKVNIETFKPEYYNNNPIHNVLFDNWDNKIRSNLKKYTFKPLAL